MKWKKKEGENEKSLPQGKRAGGFYVSLGTAVLAAAAFAFYVAADKAETLLNNDVPLLVFFCVAAAWAFEVLAAVWPKLDFGKIVAPLAYTFAFSLAAVNRVEYVIQIASHNNQVKLQASIVIAVALLLLCVVMSVAAAFLRETKER